MAYERAARAYPRTLAALPRALTARARMGVQPNSTITPLTCLPASGVRLNGGRSRYSKILSVGMRSTPSLPLEPLILRSDAVQGCDGVMV